MQGCLYEMKMRSLALKGEVRAQVRDLGMLQSGGVASRKRVDKYKSQAGGEKNGEST